MGGAISSEPSLVVRGVGPTNRTVDLKAVTNWLDDDLVAELRNHFWHNPIPYAGFLYACEQRRKAVVAFHKERSSGAVTNYLATFIPKVMVALILAYQEPSMAYFLRSNVFLDPPMFDPNAFNRVSASDARAVLLLTGVGVSVVVPKAYGDGDAQVQRACGYDNLSARACRLALDRYDPIAVAAEERAQREADDLKYGPHPNLEPEEPTPPAPPPTAPPTILRLAPHSSGPWHEFRDARDARLAAPPCIMYDCSFSASAGPNAAPPARTANGEPVLNRFEAAIHGLMAVQRNDTAKPNELLVELDIGSLTLVRRAITNGVPLADSKRKNAPPPRPVAHVIDSSPRLQRPPCPLYLTITGPYTNLYRSDSTFGMFRYQIGVHVPAGGFGAGDEGVTNYGAQLVHPPTGDC